MLSRDNLQLPPRDETTLPPAHAVLQFGSNDLS